MQVDFKEIPSETEISDVVVVYSFTLQKLMPILQKYPSHACYPGQCGFVAGKVKQRENILEAGRRELFEETGNDVPKKCIIQLGLSFPTRHWNLDVFEV
jgi:8-oxo-dGTP pyrophosphatase MutT (NUDIX family)